MSAEPPFHWMESMRTARREGLVEDFATDSVTSPEKTEFFGYTTPSTSVATESLALTLVPTDVFPAVTLCCKVAGNSRTPGTGGACGLDWLRVNTGTRSEVKNTLREKIVLA